jgi:hypothetical protein
MTEMFDEDHLASSNVGSNLLGIQSGFFGAPRTTVLSCTFVLVDKLCFTESG